MGLASNAPVTLTVVTNVSDNNSRSFSIKITQIDCLSYSRGIYLFPSYFFLHCLYYMSIIQSTIYRSYGFLLNCKCKTLRNGIKNVIKIAFRG